MEETTYRLRYVGSIVDSLLVIVYALTVVLIPVAIIKLINRTEIRKQGFFLPRE